MITSVVCYLVSHFGLDTENQCEIHKAPLYSEIWPFFFSAACRLRHKSNRSVEQPAAALFQREQHYGTSSAVQVFSAPGINNLTFPHNPKQCDGILVNIY